MGKEIESVGDAQESDCGELSIDEIQRGFASRRLDKDLQRYLHHLAWDGGGRFGSSLPNSVAGDLTEENYSGRREE